MNRKSLLLSAAVSAAGIASSIAQGYSVNAVGFVSTAIPGNNQLAILANPLIGTNQSVVTIIPTAPDGVVIYRFDPATQNYRDSIAYIDGIGWLSTDPDPQLPIGEAFWLQNPGPAGTLTFIGEVAQGAASNGVPLHGNNNLSLIASKVPESGRLADLAFPAADGDVIFQYAPEISSYRDAYSYIGGIGWLHATDPDSRGPLVPVGTGFFLLRSSASGVWNRNFTVN